MEYEPSHIRHISPGHVKASAEALSDVAALLSSQADGKTTLRIRLGHLDHGAFYTSTLQGFALMPLPTLDDEEGGAGTADPAEVLYAITLDQPVDVQRQTTLSAVATYLARQEVISSARSSGGGVTSLDQKVALSDESALLALDDVLRAQDWKAASKAVADRASASGIALSVSFSAPFIGREEISARSVFMRHVYNELMTARVLIDRTASVLSTGFEVEGVGVPIERLAQARELLAITEVQRYLAHLARDAFVCGNGYLQLGPPPQAMRLLKADMTKVLADRVVTGDDPPIAIDRQNVLHLKGMHQTAGEYGVSILEPVAAPFAQMEVTQAALDRAHEVLTHDRRPEVQEWVQQSEHLASRVAEAAAARIAEMLLGGAAGLPESPEDLYFPGRQQMEPATGFASDLAES